jgi:hypothetical protein
MVPHDLAVALQAILVHVGDALDFSAPIRQTIA